jgi:hypothetical protein
MKILFDQGTPVPLRAALVGHTVETAYERGWSTLSNGSLPAAAEEASFDVLITTDQNLPSQQTLVGRGSLSSCCRPRTGARFVSIRATLARR